MTDYGSPRHTFEGVLYGTTGEPCTRCGRVDRDPVHDRVSAAEIEAGWSRRDLIRDVIWNYHGAEPGEDWTVLADEIEHALAGGSSPTEPDDAQ